MSADEHAFLDMCRRLRPELSDAEFKARIPEFLALRRRLIRENIANIRRARAG